MNSVAEALSDPEVRDLYLIFCFALLVLPMVVMSIWFHRGINKSSGGRKLMARQRGSRAWARGSLADGAYSAGEGVSIMRDISSGRYGNRAKVMMRRVYWVTGFWVLVNAAAFGIMIWADEVNRVIE